MSKLLFWLCLVSLAGWWQVTAPAEITDPAVQLSENEIPGKKTGADLPDGIYLIERWTTVEKDLQPLFKGETLLQHDPKWLEPKSTDQTIFITINKANGVSLEQLETLDPIKQTDGRINLNMTLPKSGAKKLEQMSRKYLGRQVVVVIDGKALTMHKVRSVIKDGKMQIMRCTDDGCKVILKHLGKDK